MMVLLLGRLCRSSVYIDITELGKANFLLKWLWEDYPDRQEL